MRKYTLISITLARLLDSIYYY